MSWLIFPLSNNRQLGFGQNISLIHRDRCGNMSALLVSPHCISAFPDVRGQLPDVAAHWRASLLLPLFE